jgi:hypothetical protein
VKGRLGLALAAAAALALAGAALLLAVDGGDTEAPPLRSDSLSAEALVDSVGVVVHFNYVGTAYERQPEVLSRLRELGVHHIRDAMPSPNEPLEAGLRAARAEGIRATLATGDPARDPARAVAESLAVMGDDVAAFEGPNELDNTGDPAWPATLRRYMPALAAAVRRQAPGVPVIGPSFVNPASRSQIPPDLPGMLNGHPYPGGKPPEPVLGEALRELGRGALESGVVFTETGYHNALAGSGEHPPVSEQAAAVYMPRLLVTAFGAGVRRTFIYQLADEVPDPGLGDPAQQFGLLRSDLSPKPAFTAVQTLMAALRTSPGETSGGRLPWNLRVADGGDVNRLTLMRRDGSQVIALWRPVSVWDRDARRPVDPSPLPVGLSFGLRGARDIAVWRPSVSPRPVLVRDHAGRLPLELGGDLVLVSFR